MTDDDKRKVAIIALAEMFRKQLSEPGLRLYAAAIADIPANIVETAVCESAKSCKFMPTPAELRELAGEARIDDRATLAWEAFSRAVASVGYYKSPDFDDPIINATVRTLGGWERWCSMPSDEFDKWGRQEFVKTYAVFSRTGVNGDVAAPLVGCFERENGLLGDHRQNERVPIATGLPWAGQPVKRLGGGKRSDVPRIEFKRP